MRHPTLPQLRRQYTALPRARRIRPLPMSFYSHSPSWTTRPDLAGPLIRRTFSSGQHLFGASQAIRRTVVGLIGINTAVFAAWQYADYNEDYKLRQALMQNATLSTGNFRDGRYWTLVTSAFSHQNFPHFLFNMVSLHAFGTILSIVPGVKAAHVLSLAIGSGIAGSTAWLYHRMNQGTPRNQSSLSTFTTRREAVLYYALGASGMVTGAGAAATCLMPFAPMNLFFIPIAVPLFVVTGAYFVIDTYYLDQGTRIGHAAHLGGSIYGALFYFAYLRKFGGIWQMARRVLRK